MSQRYIQHSTVTPVSEPMIAQRSRRGNLRAASITFKGEFLITDNPVLVHVKHTKHSEAVGKAQLKAGGHPGISRAHLGVGIFKASGQMDAFTIFLAAGRNVQLFSSSLIRIPNL